jgi:hypothetical protein
MLDGVLLALEGDDRQGGSELLFGDDAGIGGGIQHERRAQEMSPLHLGPAARLAELAHLRFAAAGLGEQAGDEVALPLRVQRSHGRLRVEPATEAGGREHLRQPVDHLVVAGAVDVDALHRHADLPGGQERADEHALERSRVELRVGENQRGVIAAKLERDTGDVLRRHRHDPFTRRHAAREGHVLHERILDQHRPDLLVAPADDVQDAGRELLRYPREGLHEAERRRRRRLHHRRVAGHQGVRQRRAHDRERPVEGDDDAHDPERQSRDHRARRRRVERSDRCVQLAGEARGELEAPRKRLHLDLAFRAHLAVLAGEELDPLLLVLGERRERPPHELSPAVRVELRPSREGRVCGTHGLARLVAARGGGVADDGLRVSGVEYRELLCRFAVLPGYEQSGMRLLMARRNMHRLSLPLVPHGSLPRAQYV